MQSFLAWLGSLFGSSAAPSPEPPQPHEVRRGDPPWLVLARGELGTHEGPGDANNPKVLGYYRDAGHPEINADSVAWCAAFTGAMLERAGYASSKQLNARSYLTWGKVVTRPYPGCVAVFSRGDPRSWEGHVGFYLSETASEIEILAGNQGDAVSVGREPKSRLLGYREPVTGANSRTMRAAALGVVSSSATGAAVLASQGELMGINAVVKELGVTMPGFVAVAALLQILIFGVIIWARKDDLTSKGR